MTMIQNTPNTPILPLEILDHIFSFLNIRDYDTWSTLKACSVIHNPILHAAIDRHLYSHIDLSEWNFSGCVHYPEVYRYLSSNRYVANYIRTLRVDVRRKASSEWFDQITSILLMLPSSLEGVTLSGRLRIDATGDTSKIVLIEWSALPETFRTAFLDCLSSPAITDVCMERIAGFPLSIFNPSTRLERLSLLQCTPSTFDTKFPSQIHSVTVLFDSDQNDSLVTIVTWMKTGHDLRSLSFRSEDGIGHHQLKELLDSSSDTLIELELDFTPDFMPCYPNPINNQLTLSRISKLSQLTICCALNCGRYLVLAIISLVATSLSLKRLVLRVTASHFRVTDVRDFCKPLVSLALYSSLEHIDLRITAMLLAKEDERLLRNNITSSLMVLVPELKQLCDTGFLSMRVEW